MSSLSCETSWAFAPFAVHKEGRGPKDDERNPGGNGVVPLRLDLDEPQDDIAVALARAPEGGETVDYRRLKPNRSLALGVGLGLETETRAGASRLSPRRRRA